MPKERRGPAPQVLRIWPPSDMEFGEHRGPRDNWWWHRTRGGMGIVQRLVAKARKTRGGHR